jgi:two-component sensor histidine kinase
MSLHKSHDPRFIAAALASSDDCIKIIGLDGSLQYMTDGGQRVMEVEDFGAIKGCPWPDFWRDDGNVAALAAIQAAREGRESRFTGFAETAKRNRRFWDVKVSPIFGEDGSVESILSVSRDITAIKNFETEQELLRNELSHRIKNILALVQSLANQTLRNDSDMATSRVAFLERLHALSHAQDLFISRNQVSTTLLQLIESVISTQDPGRIDVSGPDVQLSSKSSIAFALTLHELMTNAVKYGALSNAEGKIAISWSVEPEDGAPELHFLWSESGGPTVVVPVRKGFGSRMIEKALVGYISGQASITYAPTGLVVRVRGPIAALREL